jgi:anti-anti-sigma factor
LVCIRVDRRESVAVVRVSGDLDLASADEFAADVAEAAKKSSHVVIDLGGVGFVDCAALHALERALADARHSHVRLEITGLQPQVARVVRLAGEDLQLPIVDRPTF